MAAHSAILHIEIFHHQTSRRNKLSCKYILEIRWSHYYVPQCSYRKSRIGNRKIWCHLFPHIEHQRCLS